MSAIQVSIGMDSILKCISWIANDFEQKKDPLYVSLSSRVDNLGTMIEERYRSPLKTFRDFIELNRFDKAVDSLMDASNWEGTPIINFLLGSCLVKLGKKELGQKKMATALNMNPLLALIGGCDSIHELYDTKRDFISWSCIPYTLEDTFKNKALRAIGVWIDEGISSFDFCALGGSIAFVFHIPDMNRSIYGLIDSCNGSIIWRRIVDEKEAMAIVLNSPRYVVYKNDEMYYIYSAENGNIKATFTKDTFHTVFCPEYILEDSRIMGFCTNGYVFSFSNTHNMFLIPDAHNINRRISINVFKSKKHIGAQSDGRRPHPGIEIQNYWAENIELKMNS